MYHSCSCVLSPSTEEGHPLHLEAAASLVPPRPLLLRILSTRDLCHTPEPDILALETDLEEVGQIQK